MVGRFGIFHRKFRPSLRDRSSLPAGVISQPSVYYLRRSEVIRNTTRNYADNPSTALDWSTLSNVYQLYRVEAITLRYVPRYTMKWQDEEDEPQNFPLYLVHDTNLGDTASGTWEEDNFLQYGNLRTFDLLHPFKTTFKMKRRLNMSGSTVTSTDGYISTSAPINTQHIRVYTPDAPLNFIFGTMIVEYHVRFRIRR